jgi:hypothetical protein
MKKKTLFGRKVGKPITVKVYSRGGSNVARAGSGFASTTASSTNSPLIAATSAAAKYFRQDERELVVTLEQAGTCAGAPYVYNAYSSK